MLNLLSSIHSLSLSIIAFAHHANNHQVSLIPMGLALYHNDVIVNEKAWPLTQILDNIQNGKTMKFIDGRLVRQLNHVALFPFPS